MTSNPEKAHPSIDPWRWNPRRDGPRLAAGMAISAGFAWLAIRGVDWAQTWGILTQAHWGWLLAALMSTFIAAWCRARRWRTLLQAQQPPNIGRLLGALWVGQALNALIPARLGEVARGLMIAQEADIGKAPALWSLALEKVLDALTVLAFLAILAPITPLPAWLRSAGLALGLGSLGVIILLAGISRWRCALDDRLRRYGSHHAWAERFRLRRLLEVIAGSAAIARSPRLMIALGGWSGACFLSAALPNILVARALGMNLPLAGALLLLTVLQMSAVLPLPTSPGRLGVFHYLCVVTLEIYGLPNDVSLGYALLLHAVIYLPMIGGGFWGLWQRRHSPQGT